MNIALIGNQNCGKTTLFNALTGSKAHVGNFPGVTVEKREGFVKRKQSMNVVDLPGIYSLSPYTAEEVVTRDFLIKEKPDAVINIVDGMNIERNLYLSLQVLEVGIPTVIALNMMDEVRANNRSVNVKKLSELLGVPVVPISAGKNEGVDELADVAERIAKEKVLPKKTDFCSGAVHTAIHALAHIIELKAAVSGIPVKFAAAKLIEGDELMKQELTLTENESDMVDHLVAEMEGKLGTDREAALADERYSFIGEVCSAAVKKAGESKESLRTLKIDKVLTGKFLAIPVFLAIMFLIFWLTFDVIGAFLSDMLAQSIDYLAAITDNALAGWGVNTAVHSLVIDGVFTGVGSVLSFLPIIVVLFMFLSLLEDSGYMARAAFIMDGFLRKLGLSGRSFVPMMIGFGCSVPAIMATRTLASERDRKLTMMLIPFVSCSAKLPVYAVITAALFPKHGGVVMISLYILGILVGILSSLLLKGSLFKGKPIPFVMELPPYRFPSPRSVIVHMWEKTKDFLVKAFTIIFVGSVVIWFLRSFDTRLMFVTDAASSLLAVIGQKIEFIFTPLGFGDWRIVTALISGLTAKEAVLSTLSVLFGVGEEGLAAVLSGVFPSVSSGFAFLVFTLLYMPCIAAMAAIKREMGGMMKAVGVMVYQTAVAYVVALAVYNIAVLF